jgi:hypothetical protein
MGLTSTRMTLGDGRRPVLAPIDADVLVGEGAPCRPAVAPRLACEEGAGLGGAEMAAGVGLLEAVPAGGSGAALDRGQMAGGTNPANGNIPAFLAEGCR